jgi:hypothetical protein
MTTIFTIVSLVFRPLHLELAGRTRYDRTPHHFVTTSLALGSNRSSRCRFCQECGWIQDDAAIGGLPPQPNILNDVLGFSRASEHAVCDAE